MERSIMQKALKSKRQTKRQNKWHTKLQAKLQAEKRAMLQTEPQAKPQPPQQTIRQIKPQTKLQTPQQTILLEKLVCRGEANMKKAMRGHTVATKANERIKNTLVSVILELKENYATVTNREFARLCGISNSTINNHGDIVAIKTAWLKKDAYRFRDYKEITNLAMCLKYFYDAIVKDPRTIKIMLSLRDSYFFCQITGSFLNWIPRDKHNNFLSDIYRWLVRWNEDSFTTKHDEYWLQVIKMINSYAYSDYRIPAVHYDSFIKEILQNELHQHKRRQGEA